MPHDPDILILRDPRESVKKCSLTPLRAHPSVASRTYHPERRLDADPRLGTAVAGVPPVDVPASFRNLRLAGIRSCEPKAQDRRRT